ncbi:MAG: MFS transporter [Pseudomonadota bacterium]|nr:MFS transporter [Pseudomonadota bacterium]
MAKKNSHIRGEINSRNMSVFQIQTVFICTLINMLDGFDVLVMSFAAASVSSEWTLTPYQLGILLSAGLFGMAIGSISLGALADRLGRKRLVNICLVIVTAGMFASAYSENQEQLLAFRFVTGIGIGGMLATLTTLVSEYSNESSRGLCIGFLQSGYPLGALLGGIVSVYLIDSFGWRSLFIFGGSLSLIMLPFVFWKLPESLDFLLLRGNQADKSKIQQILAKLRIETSEFLHTTEESKKKADWSSLFSSDSRANTLYLWTCYFLLMFSFYFVVSWTPKLLVDAGLTTGQGISAGVYLQAGGLVGAISLGLLGYKFKVPILTSVFFCCGVAAMLFYGLVELGLISLMLVAAIMGFFLIGAMIGLYTIAPSVYPANVRVSGVGLAIGIGRIGAIVAPLAGGIILNSGYSTDEIFVIFSIPLILAALAVYKIKLRPVFE